jgi:hypothetical protein
MGLSGLHPSANGSPGDRRARKVRRNLGAKPRAITAVF